MQTHGTPDCQGAIFIFKNDGRQVQPWTHARVIPHIRAELHSEKPSFLRALAAWNERANPANSFLAIYAHMGKSGIAPTPQGPIITWQELADALPKKVSTLWLAGCKSVLAPWDRPSDSPVTATLLVTTESRNWSSLVKIFEAEISLENINFFDQMKATVIDLLGNDEILYLDAHDPTQWKEFEARPKAQSLTEDELQNLGVLLFGS